MDVSFVVSHTMCLQGAMPEMPSTRRYALTPDGAVFSFGCVDVSPRLELLEADST